MSSAENFTRNAKSKKSEYLLRLRLKNNRLDLILLTTWLRFGYNYLRRNEQNGTFRIYTGNDVLMPSNLFYLSSLDRSISYISGECLVSVYCYHFCRNFWTYSKQCRPWSDAAFCGVWSGSSLLAIDPFIGR